MKFAASLILIVTLALSGCISRKVRVPIDQQLLPAQTKTRAELIADLEARSKTISTLVAKILLDVSGGGGKTGVLTEYRESTGIIQVGRPKQVRMQILAPVIATIIVDMVSDGHEYRVSIPPKNQFIVGDANAPPTSPNALFNLRPQHILDALFVDIQPYLNNPSVISVLEEAVNGRIRYYVLHFIDTSQKDGMLLENVWIDRTNLQVTRKQIFADDGRLTSDVSFSGYMPVGQSTFPQIISIQRPIEDYNVKITFIPDKVKLNEKLTDNAFILERPSGSTLKQIENSGPRPFERQ